jgi:hypothetical protein
MAIGPILIRRDRITPNVPPLKPAIQAHSFSTVETARRLRGHKPSDFSNRTIGKCHAGTVAEGKQTTLLNCAGPIGKGYSLSVFASVLLISTQKLTGRRCSIGMECEFPVPDEESGMICPLEPWIR